MGVCLSVCVFVSFCDKRDIPQFFSQMKSDLHETFSVLQDWSPELINNVCARAHASMHAEVMLKTKKYFFTLVPVVFV